MFAWQIYIEGLLIVTVKLLPFKNPGCEGELPLITVKSCFFIDWKIKEIVRENYYFVREMSGNFEWTKMWQP